MKAIYSRTWDIKISLMGAYKATKLSIKSQLSLNYLLNSTQKDPNFEPLVISLLWKQYSLNALESAMF